jgi:predicted GTPase
MTHLAWNLVTTRALLAEYKGTRHAKVGQNESSVSLVFSATQGLASEEQRWKNAAAGRHPPEVVVFNRWVWIAQKPREPRESVGALKHTWYQTRPSYISRMTPTAAMWAKIFEKESAHDWRFSHN